MYKATENENIIQRLSDGAYIPCDPRNADFQGFLAWLEEGNTLLPAS